MHFYAAAPVHNLAAVDTRQLGAVLERRLAEGKAASAARIGDSIDSDLEIDSMPAARLSNILLDVVNTTLHHLSQPREHVKLRIDVV